MNTNSIVTMLVNNSNVESAIVSELLKTDTVRNSLISILLDNPTIVSELRHIVASDPEKFVSPTTALRALDLECVDNDDLADLIARAAEELNSRI